MNCPHSRRHRSRPVACTGTVVHDIDNDGRPDVIMSTNEPVGRLTMFEVVDSADVCSLRRAATSNPIPTPLQHIRLAEWWTSTWFARARSATGRRESRMRISAVAAQYGAWFPSPRSSQARFSQDGAQYRLDAITAGRRISKRVRRWHAVWFMHSSDVPGECRFRDFHPGWGFQAVVNGGSDAPDTRAKCNVTSLASCDRDAERYGRYAVSWLGQLGGVLPSHGRSQGAEFRSRRAG